MATLRAVFYFFLLGVAALGALVYLGLFLAHVPGAVEERLGNYEPLPERLNEWIETESSDPRIREERYLYDDTHASKLTLQVRFRDRESREIVEVLPEREIVRKRVR